MDKCFHGFDPAYEQVQVAISTDSSIILVQLEGPVPHCCHVCPYTLDPGWVVMQELQKSRKHKLVVTLELPSFPHAVLYNQTIVGPRHAGAIEDPSSPSASLLPLYDPEVSCFAHFVRSPPPLHPALRLPSPHVGS